MKKILAYLKTPYIGTMFNKMLYCIVSFSANALFTRALGLALKGSYTWYLNYATLVSIILGLGVYHSMPFFMRNNKEKDWNGEYVNIFYSQFVIYIFLSIIFLLLKEYKIYIIAVLAILDILSQQLNMLILIDKLGVRNKVYFAGSVLNLILGAVCLIFFSDNLYAALIGFAAVKVFYIIFYTIYIGSVPHLFRFKMTDLATKIKFGFLPMLTFLLITINYKVDVIMLEAAKNVTPELLSIYSTGVSVAEIGWVIPDVFKEVLFSRIANKKNDAEVASALRVSNACIVLVILGVILLGKPFISIVYGKKFVSSYLVTIILFLGIPAMSWFKLIYQLYIAEGRRWISFGVLLLSSIINVVANIILIPIWDINGAAVASVLSYFCCGVIFMYTYSRKIGKKLYQMFIPTPKDFSVLIKKAR